MTNAKTTPTGNGKPVSAAEPFTVQYQECGDGTYLPDFRVRMPDGRVYSIAGIQCKVEYPDGSDQFLRRLFDDVERVWDELHDSDLPEGAEVQFVALATFLKDLIFRYKRENVSMSAMPGRRLHFYCDDDLILEVQGANIDDLIAYALNHERQND